jgi:hypothetical protein
MIFFRAVEFFNLIEYYVVFKLAKIFKFMQENRMVDLMSLVLIFPKLDVRILAKQLS